MYEIEIVTMDHQGRGIGYINGKVTFVKNALPKEIVICELINERKNYNEAKVLEYKNVASNRVKPFCPYYSKCGGCDLQGLSYKDTLDYKVEKVKNIFRKEKVIIPEPVVIENNSPTNYRNKLSLKIENGKLGFYEESSHTLIEITTCPLAKKSINDCLIILKKLKIKNGNVTIRSNYNDEVLLIINTKEKVTFKEDDFKNIKLVGVILNNKTIYGKNYFFERTNGCLFKVSYDAFFQVNLDVASSIFSLVEENIENKDTVLDLYSGVGILGIIASRKAKKVFSIEIVKNAVLDSLENKKYNKVTNLYPMLGDASLVLPKIENNIDTVIIDPPRKGLDKSSCDLLLNRETKKIIYVSCNPITLARDLKELTKKYEIKKLYVCDMFSYTHHVESVCILNRR